MPTSLKLLSGAGAGFHPNSAKIKETLRYRRLFAFFLPLGISASLVTISHVIINSTLTRSAHPELLIASYSVAMSLMGITEKPAVLLRQTCSRLVRDRISFRAMFSLTLYLFAAIMLMGVVIAYTPVGKAVFTHFFGVEPALLEDTLKVYQVLMFVSFFSGLRCLFQGVIIFNFHTKWLTIGMLIRLAGMYLVSWYFLATDQVTSGRVGAIIFLTGMIIECTVSLLEGSHLFRHSLPEKKEGHPIERKGQIFQFYRPLLYSSILAVVIGPSINAFLGKTGDMQLAIASYAIAFNLAQLMQSFFSYVHQIVLNFYRKDPRTVLRFCLMIGFFPGLLVMILAYTSCGPWFLEHVMGVKPGTALMDGVIHALRIFMIMNFIFPWLDFCNGLVMLQGQTKIMVLSQASNVLVTLVSLLLLILWTPGWNGMIGALAQSLGVAAEITMVLLVLRYVSRHPLKMFDSAAK